MRHGAFISMELPRRAWMKLFAAAAFSQAWTRTSFPTKRGTSSARLSPWQPNEWPLPTSVTTITAGIPHPPTAI